MFTFKEENGIGIFEFSGEIGLDKAENLENQMKKNTQDGIKNYIFDFRYATLITYSTYGVILRHLVDLKKNTGRSIITGITDRHREVLKLLNMERHFEYTETIEDAIDLFKD